MAIATIIAGTMAYRRFGALVQPTTLARVLIAATAVALASVLWPLSGPLIVVKIALLGSLYLLVLFGPGEITKADFKLLKKRPRSSLHERYAAISASIPAFLIPR